MTIERIVNLRIVFFNIFLKIIVEEMNRILINSFLSMHLTPYQVIKIPKFVTKTQIKNHMKGVKSECSSFFEGCFDGKFLLLGHSAIHLVDGALTSLFFLFSRPVYIDIFHTLARRR